jgi:hypothetical protein
MAKGENEILFYMQKSLDKDIWIYYAASGIPLPTVQLYTACFVCWLNYQIATYSGFLIQNYCN